MNPAQIHLMLNHIPVVGTIFTLVLVALGTITGNRHMLRIALATAVVVAAIAVPVFLTGEPVEELVENLPGVSESLIERHEGAAKVALGAVVAVGLAALVGLVRFGGRAIPRGFALVALVLNLGAAGHMIWTAHLGGQIRHTEIRAKAALPVGEDDERGAVDSD